ncbi:NAD(P)/FAD-dependent oxidoreductase [Pararhodospirillum oryzae]|uniref:FAD dependent oxidoreductase domain-containing protein n=1 Tax=Pararhodospirillum oryzae TaxID=478448 RepID=A0A512H873_9PROT|nr:FAD-binding oxidoreductase [Pararhodospirillum oryzae]GEO81656.1 hypothetical protein ROR02_17870 [Pararhodospirillum oryzae]
MSPTLPASARVAVIGGGVLGLSVACHLIWAGIRDVVVIERQTPASGATARAAALLTRARPHALERALVRATYAALDRLMADPDAPALDVHRVGAVHLSADPATVAALTARLQAGAREGDPVRALDEATVRALVPWLDPGPADLIALSQGDAYLDPYALAQAYGAAARRGGARIIPDTEVLAVRRSRSGAVTGLETSRGGIDCRTVVLSAGAWSSPLAAAAGLGLAQAPVRSLYWITAPDPALGGHHPLVVMPDAGAYARPELGGLLFGVREAVSRVADPRALPSDLSGFSFGGDPDAWDDLLEAAPRLLPYWPGLPRAALAHAITGPSAYTADGRFLVGPVASVPGLVVATGCCGAGIAASGGIGQSVAALIAGTPLSWDPAPLSPTRFGRVDPFDPALWETCARVRAGKRTG